MKKLRRYSINIPRYYGERNPELKGNLVPDEELLNTVSELQEKVEGMTGMSGLKLFPRVPNEAVPFEGVWRNIWDTGIIIYLDVPLSEKRKMDKYLSKYKETLAERFVQAEMYIVSWEIEAI